MGCGNKAAFFLASFFCPVTVGAVLLDMQFEFLSLNPNHLLSPEIRGLTDAVSLLGLA